MKKNRLRNSVVLGAVSFAVSALLYAAGALDLFELKAFDVYSRLLNPARSSDRIAIIEVDQRSIDALSRESINWPWPRQMYAPIVEYLSKADAVFIDILFTEPSSYGHDDDRVLAEAIGKASNVYLPFFLSKNPKEPSSEGMLFVKRHSVGEARGRPSPYRSVTVPVDLLGEHAAGAGNVSINPDGDGVYRTIPLLFQFRDIVVPNLVLSYFIKQKRWGIPRPDRGTEEKVLLRYFREQRPFQTFSAVDILNAAIGKDPMQSMRVKKGYFKGKVVFIGMTAAGLYDLKPTPVSSVATGVHIHATLFDNLQGRDFMRTAHPLFVVLGMLAIVSFICAFVLSHYAIVKNLAVFVGAFFTILGATALLFLNARYVPVVYPVVALVVSFILSVAFSYAAEGKERIFIRRTFSQYMDKTLVDHVLQNPEIIRPGGRRLRVTVFFADIAGFTTISEQNPPEETAKMLHSVLDALTEVVIKEKGVIDKYIGDCVMAFWGAPLRTENDEVNACRAALNCIAELDSINEKFRREGIPSVSIRIGIHSGDAIAGNLGSTRLFDYTVVGDTVNTASRLESVNKAFRTGIIASENTIEKTGGLFLARELGLIEVKGKKEPVRIYEVMAEIEGAGEGLKEKAAIFHEALALYRQGGFADAIALFTSILERYPDDGPAAFYKNRCGSLMASCLIINSYQRHVEDREH
ncbi:MAG TPA: CHASE2 domain-containing protein, partial [Syntrophorhabdaceae bacterium]|nr:CHASE2 domain-containing protein [Syntrophorhabdaceae bacterium]HQM81814.1 CHASE2 domain-containing protein [Syntrophorhabdaceae bacterium]